MSMTRKFDGAKFLKLSTKATKTSAKKYAGTLREKGYNTRVIKAPYPDGYYVFGKRK